MRIAFCCFLIAAALGGARTAVSEESVRPEVTGKGQETRKSPERDPFTPSPAMREIARRAAVRANGDASGESSPEAGFILDGLVVRSETSLASFRVGKTSVLLAPGESFQAGEVRYTFVKCVGEAAVLRGQDGRECEVRAAASAKS